VTNLLQELVSPFHLDFLAFLLLFMTSSLKEEALWQACTEGDLPAVKLLLADSSVNVNWADAVFRRTSFYRACFFGQALVVEHLLGRSQVDVNLAQKDGATPVCVACQEGMEDVVGLLLLDNRVELNKFASDSSSPLWMGAQEGQLRVVQQLLASGREIDTAAKSEYDGTTPAQHARIIASQPKLEHETEVDAVRRADLCSRIADLIDDYDRDQTKVRADLRGIPGLREHFAAHTFALVVFYCDEFVTLDAGCPPQVGRFFAVAASLPMDLQMVLCNRLFRSGSNIVSSAHSEAGFRWLARPHTWSDRR